MEAGFCLAQAPTISTANQQKSKSKRGLYRSNCAVKPPLTCGYPLVICSDGMKETRPGPYQKCAAN